MSTNEFKVRALYNFVGEGSSELSFNAEEILIITATTAGDGWWYAKNSVGDIGAVPANYVETIDVVSDPTIYSNIDYDINNQQQQQQQEDQYYMAPLPDNNLSTQEPILQSYDQLNEQNVLNNNSFNSLISSTTHENSSHTLPVTSNSFDPYMSILDSSPPPPPLPTNSVPMSTVNSSSTINTMPDQSDPWFFDDKQASVPMFSHNPLSPFGYPQTTSTQQQMSAFDDFIFPAPTGAQPSVKTDSNYDIPSSLLMFSSNEPTKTQTVSSPPQVVDATPPMNSSTNVTSSKSSTENLATSPATKTKKEKNKFFTLKRQKSKPGPEKRHSLTESVSEPLPRLTKEETDSDDFNDSMSASKDTATNKTTTGGNETKAAPRARFFDKHGLDNYLLHGCKIKSDEHVEISYDEKEGGVYWSYNPTMPPFTCKIEEATKGSKLAGLKSYMEYKIHTQIPGGHVVGRRYKQFDWLHEQLVNKYRFICVPPLPEKQIAGRYEQEFIEERRRQLEIWLNRICHHPVLCASFPVQHFVTCEVTEKNNKDWKAGKRKIEKDELREAPWLHCVSFINSNLTDTQIASQIDAFAQQQPGLETHLKNLHQGLTKYLERHTEIYERDIQRIGELFSKLYTVLQVDTTTSGNKELSNSTSKISSAYNGIAELYKTKATEGIRDFNERIQEYIGLLICFPMILPIQRSASEFMRTVQQRGPSIIADFNTVIHRSQVLNHVVLAEINYFQKEKVKNLSLYMKALLNEQIQFYEKITSELREAASTFD